VFQWLPSPSVKAGRAPERVGLRAAGVHFNLSVLSLRYATLLGKLGRATAAASRVAVAIDSLKQAPRAPADWPKLRACCAKLAEAEAALRVGG
jgi:hypothetical protein